MCMLSNKIKIEKNKICCDGSVAVCQRRNDGGIHHIWLVIICDDDK